MQIAVLELDGQGGATERGAQAAEAWRSGGAALWLHLDATHPDCRAWLLDELALDEWVVEALLAEETRPRAVELAGGWLVVLRGVNLNPGAEPEDMVSVRIWSDGTRVVSTRLRWLRAVATEREALLAGHGAIQAGDLLARLAAGLVNNMQAFSHNLAERLDDLEEQLETQERRELLTDLSALRRQTVILRRYLAPQRDALQRLLGARVDWLQPEARAGLVETTDDLTRYVEDLDALKDRAGILQETLTNRLSERMEHRMYALTLIATIFLPLTFVTGLLGINVAGIPGSDYRWAFWVVVVVLLGISTFQVWLLRRGRWF